MGMKQKIMIVDDAEINRQILMAILGDKYEYVQAENGCQAVHMLQHDLTIELILLDINMPEMNGFQMLERMNKFHWIDEIPVIMISSEEKRDIIERAYILGAEDYIRRPFDAFIVRRRVQNILNLYANQKRLKQMVSDQIYEKEENNNLMIGILSHVVEFRNSESGEHIIHIRMITELLLRCLVQKTDQYHLSESDIAIITTASALHDIGKISIPESILNKPGKLTQEEFETMKTHTTIGADIIRQMFMKSEKPLIRSAWEICRWHHERWDGHGYPDGLLGEKIPISAQVVALADVYDALTSKRCYKNAYDHETAMNMIMSGECGAFNPLLLKCLYEISPKLRMVVEGDMGEETYRQEADRLAADVMKIKPVMKFGVGKLDVYQKCRGMKNARKAMIDAMKKEFETNFKEAYEAGKLYLMAASSSTAEVTEEWIRQIKESFPGMDVMCDNLSLGLSCHIGPDGLGIACCNKAE